MTETAGSGVRVAVGASRTGCGVGAGRGVSVAAAGVVGGPLLADGVADEESSAGPVERGKQAASRGVKQHSKTQLCQDPWEEKRVGEVGWQGDLTSRKH